MAEFVPISEAKARLSAIVRESDSEDVLLLRHGRPAAVVVSTRRYNALLEEIEDLKDRLSVHERDGVTVGLDKVIAELGLKGPLKEEP
jgi:prevent-host-death family protein